ncbi:hypothetical protein GEMRC1_011629 [Eukaryota sp. GEM-RC1]
MNLIISNASLTCLLKLRPVSQAFANTCTQTLSSITHIDELTHNLSINRISIVSHLFPNVHSLSLVMGSFIISNYDYKPLFPQLVKLYFYHSPLRASFDSLLLEPCNHHYIVAFRSLQAPSCPILVPFSELDCLSGNSPLELSVEENDLEDLSEPLTGVELLLPPESIKLNQFNEKYLSFFPNLKYLISRDPIMSSSICDSSITLLTNWISEDGRWFPNIPFFKNNHSICNLTDSDSKFSLQNFKSVEFNGRIRLFLDLACDCRFIERLVLTVSATYILMSITPCRFSLRNKFPNLKILDFEGPISLLPVLSMMSNQLKFLKFTTNSSSYEPFAFEYLLFNSLQLELLCVNFSLGGFENYSVHEVNGHFDYLREHAPFVKIILDWTS